MSERVLVVHSHPLMAESVRRIALSVGVQALSCLCFSDARRLIEQWNPKLVLTELALPDAIGDELPSYATSRGVDVVWALSSEHKPHAYRRAPARSYGTDGWLGLHEVPRDFGPRISALWPRAGVGGRGDDTHGVMTKICSRVLSESTLIQSWDISEARAKFDAWIQTPGAGFDIEPGSSTVAAIDALFFSAGLGHVRKEAV